MSAHSGSKKVVLAALAGDFTICVIKFIASAITGSSAMLAEAVHSVVDTLSELLLLFGLKRATHSPDERHPLGYGREMYFWSFVVAILLFALGAGVAFYEGITQMRDPQPVQNSSLNYIVLLAAMIFELVTWFFAFTEFRRGKGSRGYMAALKASKDPTVFTILFEDSSAIIGLLIAFSGLFFSEYLNMPLLDGIASIGVALLLGGTAMLLARASKELLIGEPVLSEVHTHMQDLVLSDPDVCNINNLITVHMGPKHILAGFNIEFVQGLNTAEIEQCFIRLQDAIRLHRSEIVTLYIRPQAAKDWKLQQEQREKATEIIV